MRHKWVGGHPQDLADGTMLAVGDEVNLDGDALDHPHNRDLLDRGLLIPVEEQEPSKGGKKTGGES
jgi:hypothetical protein